MDGKSIVLCVLGPSAQLKPSPSLGRTPPCSWTAKERALMPPPRFPLASPQDGLSNTGPLPSARVSTAPGHTAMYRHTLYMVIHIHKYTFTNIVNMHWLHTVQYSTYYTTYTFICRFTHTAYEHIPRIYDPICRGIISVKYPIH